MKKLLALVLALVMVLGLATVSTSAAYSDADDIDYTEAVDVMTAVGVFQGKGDAFAPNDNLNRAEAAKLIAYLMLGNKTAESMVGSGTRFTDVPASHWAAGYIEYLASVGIVSGVGGGQFNPNGQVTSVQFAKMLLVALGYDAEIEKFVGEGWSINIQKLANQNDLFDGLDISANDALTRQQAAQMCLNDLQADMVEYDDKGTTVQVGGATVVTGVKNAKEKEEKNGHDYNNGAYHDYVYQQLVEFLYGDDLKLNDGYRDDFGRPSNRWVYKNEEVGIYASKADLVKTYDGSKVTRSAMYDLLGKSVYDNLVSGDSTLRYYEDGRGFGTNGIVASGEDNVKLFIERNNSDSINNDKASGNGVVTEIYMNDDDDVTIIVTNTYVYQASSDYRASTEDLIIESPTNAVGTNLNLDSYKLELEDFEGIKDIKEDDYLLIKAYWNGTNYTADSMKKAELLTGTVDKVVVKDTVTIDGEVKKYSKKINDTDKGEEYSVGQEATVVLDAYGYIIYVDEAVVAKNYVFIADIGQTNSSINGKVVANAYFTDGSEKDITIKEIAGEKTKSALVKESTATLLMDKSTTAATPGAANASNSFYTGVSLGNGGEGVGVVGNKLYAGWYTYSKNSSDEYTLYALKDTYKQGVEYAGSNILAADKTAVTDGKIQFLKDDAGTVNTTHLGSTYFKYAAANGAGVAQYQAGAVLANDKTIFIVADDDDNVDVFTGVKNIPEVVLQTEDATNQTTKGALNGSVYVSATQGALDGGQAVIFSTIKRSTGYAEYVFVSLEGNNSVYGSEAESLKYFLKFDKEHKITDNENYYVYTMLDENTQEVKVESEKILKGTIGGVAGTDFDGSTTAKTNMYRAYYKTNTNNKDQYTKAEELNANNFNGTKYFYDAQTNVSDIKYNNGNLSIGGETFTLADNYKITAVVTSGAKDLLKDKGADYEAVVVSASGLEAMVGGYKVSYQVAARLDDTYNANKTNKLVEAYVTISGATSTSVAGINSATLTVGANPATSVTSYLAATEEAAIKNAYDVTVTTATNLVFAASTKGTKTITHSNAIPAAADTFGNDGGTFNANTDDNGKYVVWKLVDKSVDGTTNTVTRYFAVKITAGYSVTINNGAGSTLGGTYTATVDGAAYTTAVNKNQGTSTTIVVSAKGDNTLKTVAATVNSVDVAGTMNAEKTQWTLTTPVSGAVVVTVTTEGAPTSATVKYDAKEPVIVTFTDGATGTKTVSGDETTADLVTVSDNTKDLSFTVAWGSETPDFAKNVYYKDTGAKVATFGSGDSLTYRVPAANLGKTIVFGSATTTLTLSTGYTATWTAAAATSNKNAFGEGSINGNGAAQKVPVDAVLTLAKAEAPAHFAKYVTTPGSMTSGATETVYVTTDNTKPTFDNNHYTVGTGAATLTVAETTAEVKVLTSLIGAGTLSNNGSSATTAVSQGANAAKFVDATGGYTYFDTANTAALNVAFEVLCSTTATNKKTITVAEDGQGVKVVNGTATNTAGISADGKLVSGGAGSAANTVYTIPLALKTAGQTIDTLGISLTDWGA